MEILEQELTETIKAWPTVSKVLSTLHSEEQYDRAVEMLDQLIDKINRKEDPSIESLIDTLGALIKDFEGRKFPEPLGDSMGCLEYLIVEHNLKQSDLKELGSQGVVSEILNGKRQLNIRQIKALSKRFNVSPAVFI